jgi:hypothetical protein
VYNDDHHHSCPCRPPRKETSSPNVAHITTYPVNPHVQRALNHHRHGLSASHSGTEAASLNCYIDGQTQNPGESATQTVSPWFHYFVIESLLMFLLPALPYLILCSSASLYPSIHFRSSAARHNAIRMAFHSHLSPCRS